MRGAKVTAVKLCPTVAGYSPDAPLPTFDRWRPFRPVRAVRSPRAGGRRKWPLLEAGQVVGCYEVMGLSRGRQGRADSRRAREVRVRGDRTGF